MKAIALLCFLVVCKGFKIQTLRNWNRNSKLYNTEIVDASYNLAAGSAVLGTVFGGLENLKENKGFPKFLAQVFGAGAIVFTLFGGFIAYQTTTLRFTFDDTGFALVKSDGKRLGENVVVGGENRWAYESFVNW